MFVLVLLLITGNTNLLTDECMNELMYLYFKKWYVYLCTLVYAGVYLLSDASPYCDVILAPRMVIVLSSPMRRLAR